MRRRPCSSAPSMPTRIARGCRAALGSAWQRSASRSRQSESLALFWLGEVYAARPNTPENRARAEEDLRAALKADPRFADAYFELGRLLARSGRDSEAEAVLREAIRLDPSLEDPFFQL